MRSPAQVEPVTKFSRQGLPSQVASYIRDRIVQGKLNPGDRLPTEREMASQHGVSRAVIREAVAKLIQQGLVISRQGAGAFVATPDNSTTLVLDPQNLAQPKDFRQLYELRLVLESGAAELAARNCDAGDLEAIGESIANMALIEDSHAVWVERDIAFHRSVAAATKNAFIALFISFVGQRLQESIFVALKKLDFSTMKEVSIREHQSILDAIRARDPGGAGEAMRAHLQNSSRRLGL